MFGLMTREAGETDLAGFDRTFYEVKDVTGRAAPPESGVVNAVSTFADDAAVRTDPDLAAVDADGTPADREAPYFDWAHVCPTHPDYRAGLLEMIADCTDAAPDLRLDDVGFPRAGYCRCERCETRFATSPHDDRAAWRAAVVTEFVADAADRVPGDLYLAVHPDPYPGHLYRRSGIDLPALLAHVDAIVAPLYDTTYGTTHWIETLARGFRSALAAAGATGGPDWRSDPPADLPVRLAVELYAVDVDVDALVDAIDVADAYADEVYLGYDASTATAALRRRRARANEGTTHRPDDVDG